MLMSVRRDVGASVVWGSDMAQKGDFRGGVFISYRRALSIEHAVKLYEVLKDHLGERRVFFDQTAIPQGAEFPEEIETALNHAHLVLIVIAPGWTKDIHTRALDPCVDWVRREAAITQSRRSAADPPEVRVVLVGGASMPAEHELPEDLHWLTAINAFPPVGKELHFDPHWVEVFRADINAAVPCETTALDKDCLESLAVNASKSVLERLENWTDFKLLSELQKRWERTFSVPKDIDPVGVLNELKTALTSLNTDGKTILVKLAMTQRRALQQDCVAIVAELLRLGACRLMAQLPVIGNHTTPASTRWLATQAFAVAHSQGGRKACLVLDPGTLTQVNRFPVDRTLDQGTVSAGILEDQSSSILDQLWRLVPEFKDAQPTFSPNPKNPEAISDLAEALNSMSREDRAARIAIALQSDSTESAGAYALRRWLVRMGLEIDVLVRTGKGAGELEGEEHKLIAPCWRCLKQIEGLSND